MYDNLESKKFNVESGKLRSCADIEKILITKFRKKAWTPFFKAVKEYNLIQAGDSIAAAISGGKDSLVTAKLLQEIQRHGDVQFDLKFIFMDPGYTPENLQILKDNCEHLGLQIHIEKRNIFDRLNGKQTKYPCYLCARMRRGALYSMAKSLSCNKVALGHHFDDVIETILLNILCSGKYQTMMPKLKSNNFDNMELIRPSYYVREDNISEIISWSGINVINCGCSLTSDEAPGKRAEIKTLIKTLGLTFKDVDKCIYQSTRNVYIDAIIEWVDGSDRINFLDKYF